MANIPFDQGMPMKPVALLLLLTLAGARVVSADDAAAKVQYFTAAQLTSQIAQPKDGLASNQFLNGPGAHVYLLRRDNTGVTEIHMNLNDIIIVKSGHAKITVGGQVAGNKEEQPSEWRGGDITGGKDYSLAAGDVLFIPAGLPHRVLVAPKATITYLVVKTPK
jgi:mannose-6-phosphate isomerase-like protein (cupin superfamily)